MEKAIHFVPRVAIFLAGVAAGALTLAKREGSSRGAESDPAIAKEIQESIARLEERVASQEKSGAARFSQIEARLDEHAGRLAEMPSTGQIVAAMEQLLSKTMASLDDRLTTQAHSIEVLKTTVSQTDSLLERVLESLDSLQTYTDSSEIGEDVLLHPTA